MFHQDVNGKVVPVHTIKAWWGNNCVSLLTRYFGSRGGRGFCGRYVIKSKPGDHLWIFCDVLRGFLQSPPTTVGYVQLDRYPFHPRPFHLSFPLIALCCKSEWYEPRRTVRRFLARQVRSYKFELSLVSPSYVELRYQNGWLITRLHCAVEHGHLSHNCKTPCTLTSTTNQLFYSAIEIDRYGCNSYFARSVFSRLMAFRKILSTAHLRLSYFSEA
jgi:hypothetical protein